MLKNNLIISVLSLVFVSACTQPPAQIEMKGQQSFSRGNQSSYNSSSSRYGSNNSSSSSSSNYNSNTNSSYDSAPVSEATEQNASVSSIGISDLAPPSSTKQETKEPQFKDEEISSPIKSESKKGSKPVLKTTVNPWTNKPRSSNEPQAKPIKQEVKVAVKEEKVVVAKTKVSSELKWPIAGKKIISSFGAKGAGKANDGINIAAEDGDPVWAAAGGQVVYVSNEMKGFGNMVFIKHNGARTTSYAHLSRIIVDKYDRVEQGDVIGYVGTTGSVKTPQLFFSLHKGKEAIDPQKYISKEVAGL